MVPRWYPCGGENVKVLVCGGRDYDDYFTISHELDSHRPTLVITGGAVGADHRAGVWAERNGVPLCIFPPHWGTYGNKAGPLRNSWMLEFGKPDLVLAFPGGKGTADMVRQARRAGIEVREVKP